MRVPAKSNGEWNRTGFFYIACLLKNGKKERIVECYAERNQVKY